MLEDHVDIWHVYNEPNFIFKVVRDNSQKPIVFDIHDWTSLREAAPVIPDELIAEKLALEGADGFVTCSMGYQRHLREQTQKPNVMVYSMVPAALYPTEVHKTKPGLVYEGGLKGKTDLEINYPYRNWAAFLKEAVKTFPEGHKAYCFSAGGPEDFGDYQDDKIEVYDYIRYDQLLVELSRSTVGLVGSPMPLKDFRDSMPNKLFEYIAAGTPCLVINAPEAQQFVEMHNLGVGIRDPSEVATALDKLTNHNISKDRFAFTMETQIGKLVALYEEVMCVKLGTVLSQPETQLSVVAT